MTVSSRHAASRVVKTQLLDRYRTWALQRQVPAFPAEATLPLADAEDVLLVTSGYQGRVHHETVAQELAFALELAGHHRPFAVTDDASRVFGKRVVWFVYGRLVSPRLWDYSRQVHEFAQGLERQGNTLFCSADETRYWENKAYMHRRLDEVGVAVPPTTVVTAETAGAAALDAEPLLVKEEHAAGSSGLHFFATAAEAQDFLRDYRFRPGESLIVQGLVPGATRDLRVTMVGDRAIPDATYWRIKSDEALASSRWTPTATTYGTRVVHEEIPPAVVARLAEQLRALGVRTAGVDLIWPDDDLSQPPLMLEFSPYYQPNPPKPARYDEWTYKRYKQRAHVKDGYLAGQFRVYREIARELLDQGLL
jgi:hypothetical protein